MPTVYIGKSQEDYSSGSSSINAPGGNATTTLYAYTKTGTPTSYSWNAEFYGECDRWYTYPSGNRLDVSVYLNSQHYGGSLRITCAMYNGSSLRHSNLLFERKSVAIIQEQGSRRNKILVLDSIYLNRFRSKLFR